MATPLIPAIRLTYDELVAIQDRPEYAGLRLELIDGELFVTAAPNFFHQRVSMNMTFALELHNRAWKLGVVLAAPIEVRLATDTAVQPDISFVSRERRHLITPRGIDGAPDFVVEILSLSTRNVDLTRKKAAYEELGVLEYRIVDPDRYRVDIFSLVDGRYVSVPIDDGIARSRVIPGFAIALTDLFEDF